MFRVRRKFYDIGLVLTPTPAGIIKDGGLAAALGDGTLLPGDEIMYGPVSQVRYGIVNAAGNDIILATN